MSRAAPAPMPPAPFLSRVVSVPERLEGRSGFPFDLPFVPSLALELESAVTFFVGENGSGKSTLLEAIADLCRLPVSGGGPNERGLQHGPEAESPLAPALRPGFRRQPRDGFFLRAEFHAHFASLLEARAEDRWSGDPYARYGGKSLHRQSHGESFLALIQHRLTGGMLLLDEPEAALSPQRQLVLLAEILRLVATTHCAPARTASSTIVSSASWRCGESGASGSSSRWRPPGTNRPSNSLRKLWPCDRASRSSP